MTGVFVNANLTAETFGQFSICIIFPDSSFLASLVSPVWIISSKWKIKPRLGTYLCLQWDVYTRGKFIPCFCVHLPFPGCVHFMHSSVAGQLLGFWEEKNKIRQKTSPPRKPQDPQRAKAQTTVFLASLNVSWGKRVVLEWITNKFTTSKTLVFEVIMKWSFN